MDVSCAVPYNALTCGDGVRTATANLLLPLGEGNRRLLDSPGSASCSLWARFRRCWMAESRCAATTPVDSAFATICPKVRVAQRLSREPELCWYNVDFEHVATIRAGGRACACVMGRA
jgi:hypothetical protein